MTEVRAKLLQDRFNNHYEELGLLYEIINVRGEKHFFYQYDKALECYESEGIKFYIKTKSLFPIKALLSWK